MKAYSVATNNAASLFMHDQSFRRVAEASSAKDIALPASNLVSSNSGFSSPKSILSSASSAKTSAPKPAAAQRYKPAVAPVMGNANGAAFTTSLTGAMPVLGGIGSFRRRRNDHRQGSGVEDIAEVARPGTPGGNLWNASWLGGMPTGGIFKQKQGNAALAGPSSLPPEPLLTEEGESEDEEAEEEEEEEEVRIKKPGAPRAKARARAGVRARRGGTN